MFTLQESHYSKKGRCKIDGFEIFEAIRKNKKDGGTIIGVHKSLNPIQIQEYHEEFELLVVEIVVNSRCIRVISGYGPQETWPEAERLPFFLALEDEILKSTLLGKSIIVQLDANSKLGQEFIAKDIHDQSPNGALLGGIIKRNNLIVANALNDKVTGLITRRRTTVNSEEESIIDFVILSEDMREFLDELIIDEEKNHTITGYMKTKNEPKVSESDHMTMLTKFNLKWKRNLRKDRVEMFNLKDFSCQKKFFELTSSSDYLSSVFDTEDDVDKSVERFLKRLNDVLHKCFRKVRITEKVNAEYEDLMKRRNSLRKKHDNESIEELKVIEDKLADLCAKANKAKIEEELNGIKCDEGGIHSGKLWKLRKKLFPNSRDPPTAMFDKDENLVTSEAEIEKLAIETYVKRLSNREMRPNLQSIREQKEKLCALKLKVAKNNKTEPWTMHDLDVALKSLKWNKSRDPFGLANEIFLDGVAGSDLKIAVLKMMNKIKSEQQFTRALQQCNISSIWKKKGSRHVFDFPCHNPT